MWGDNQSPAALVGSWEDWWALAGVDAAVGEEPANWLQPRAVLTAPLAAPAAAVETARPETLAAFHDWLAEDQNVPEAGWGSVRCLPQGAEGAKLMVVSDMPDPEDSAEGALFVGAAGHLLDGMLRAIGLERSSIYLASLAICRPPGGQIEVTTQVTLAERMRRQVALVRPGKLLLLGERTCRALLEEGISQRLRSFNHGGGTVSVVGTHHPRLLLRQPILKADCWRALQLLIEDKTL
jgi:DNA polymerase